MPDIKFDCPHCKQSLEAPEDMANDLIDCPSCGKTLQVPLPPKTTPKLRIKSDQAPHLSQAKPMPPPACRYCGAPAPHGAVFCVACGRDLKTGRQFRTETESAIPRRRESPRPVQQSSNSGWIVLLVLIVAGYFGYQIYRDKTPGNSTTATATRAQREAPAAQPEPPKPTTFTVSVKVAAFTLKGTQFPSHSITFELYVNGEKVRSMDGTSILMDFPSVPVKPGDVLSGRALWRNGYGAVGQVNASYQDTKTVKETDRGKDFFLKTYDGDYLSTPENRHEWF